MEKIIIVNYNNYFNRILKKLDSVADYAALTGATTISSINFNPADGVDTTLILGKGTAPYNNWEVNSPDYLIVYKTETNSDGTSDVILSRWFITDIDRTRGGQWNLTLKRDVLADYAEEIKEAPCFVEKGMISNVNNPLIYNSEGMKFNEIKKSEKPLRDATQCAWLVGYLNKSIDEATTINYTPTDELGDSVVNITTKEWKDCITFQDLDGTIDDPDKKYFKMDENSSALKFKIQAPVESITPPSPSYHDTACKLSINLNCDSKKVSIDDFNGSYEGMSEEAMIIHAPSWFDTGINYTTIKWWMNRVLDKIATTSKSYYESFKSNAIDKLKTTEVLCTSSENILDFNDKYVVKDSKVYKLTISPNKVSRAIKYNADPLTSAVANSLFNSLEENQVFGTKTYRLVRTTGNEGKIRSQFKFEGIEYDIIAQEVVVDETVTFTLPVSASRNQAVDAQYDMFAIPVNPEILGINSVSERADDLKFNLNHTALLSVNSSSDIGIAIATKLCTALGAGGNASKIYDLQLLPYCPIDLKITKTAYGIEVDLDNLTNADYGLMYNNADTPAARGIIFYPRKANFSRNIDFNISNESVHYEEQTLVDPVFIYNNTSYQGDPLYRFEWPGYEVADDTWDLSVDDLTLPESIEDIHYLEVYVSSGHPVILLCSDSLPWDPTPSEAVTVDGEIKLKADWIIPDKPIDIKVKNECDFQRIVSPNYNGMFQFKVSRMFDGVNYINVDCTYKPYTPYIKLNPDFNGLYGQDWNDSTGLICSGDFSIPMINDVFTQYELQNKNYQAIFARSVENLDVNQQIAKEQQQFTGIVGTITGGVGGGAAGFMAGSKAGPWGAAIGTAVGLAAGTTLGAVGYAKDKEWLERSQAEARDYVIDQFNYKLGNIQALPQTITKSSPLSFNNKVWPIFEQFSCTDEEKEMLRQKIKYDGMTVMAVGRLDDYIIPSGFVKGQLIRLTTVNEDTHMVNAIYDRVNRGFYEGE